MKSMLKRFGVSSLGLLILLHNLLALIGAQTPTQRNIKIYSAYGAETRARTSSRATRVPSPVTGMSTKSIRAARILFSAAGGVMFDAVGAPCAGISGGPVKLSYDRRRPNGERLVLNVGAKAYRIPGVYDHELRPIAKFVSEGSPVVVNLLSDYKNESENECIRPRGLMVVTLPDAFLNTRLGWHLTRADMLPWSYKSLSQWHTRADIPESPELTIDALNQAFKKDFENYDKELKSYIQRLVVNGKNWYGELSELEKYFYTLNGRAYYADWTGVEKKFVESIEIDKKAWDKLSKEEKQALILKARGIGGSHTSNINDVESNPGFCVEGDSVVFEGAPRIEFLAPLDEGTYVLQSSSNLFSKNQSVLSSADQEAYDAMVKVFRIGSLFRYMKGQLSPASWRRFVLSLPPGRPEETPQIVCPECETGQVQEWIKCAERKPSRAYPFSNN